MSRVVNIEKLSDKELEKISTDLRVEQEPSKYERESKVLYLFDQEGENVYVPFEYDTSLPRPERKDLGEMKVEFVGKLREEQNKVKDEALDCINRNGSAMVCTYCGFGKTCIGIFLACRIKLKTLILCHRIVLIQQWKNAIKSFCPKAKIQVLSAKKDMNPYADFYIINAPNVKKHERDYFSNIGLVIVDEAHIIMAEKMSECMRYITPRYVIGLTATPYRTDGLDILLDMYFGKQKIIRKLFRRHIAYKVQTTFTPEMRLNKMGKVDWNSVLESQCANVERNELIIKIIRSFSDKVFLVLTKRVDQGNYLVKRLQEEGEDVTSLIGKNQTYEQKSRILVGTVGKCSVGFDHPRLNAMLLASDVEQYFVQYLGRVFRTQEGIPVIFDILDNNPILNKHFRTRCNTYIEHGGMVKDFWNEFPNFE
jgi:superfamily II DNA or RNA helicase